ncbi:hypothetical protein BS78_06G242600 [Paspalum vaginatum]|nr:hypothetical protein BS78_06G242600 [Paspalum vaginatum]
MKKPLDGPFTFNPHRSCDLMMRWCISAKVAFNKFEGDNFEPWMESLQPTFKCVGRQTIRNDCVSMFEKTKRDIQTELQNIDSHICFTSDLWTSNKKLGYICLTAHYIGPDFVLKKKSLLLEM